MSLTAWLQDRSLAYKVVKGLDTLLRMRVVHKCWMADRGGQLPRTLLSGERSDREDSTTLRPDDAILASAPETPAESGSPSCMRDRQAARRSVWTCWSMLSSIASRMTSCCMLWESLRKSPTHLPRSQAIMGEGHHERSMLTKGRCFPCRVNHEAALDFVKRRNTRSSCESLIEDDGRVPNEVRGEYRLRHSGYRE